MRATSPSARAQRAPRSGIRGIIELALGVPDVVRLEIGDPGFAAPPHVIEATADVARKGFRQ